MNYTSCVFSVIFADLAQLITVLAIAKTLSPALHHLPTTINTQPPHPLLSESAPPLLSWALLRIPDNRTSARSSFSKLKQSARCHQSARSPLCALMRNRHGVGYHPLRRAVMRNLAPDQQSTVPKKSSKGNPSKSKQRAPAKSAPNSKKGTANALGKSPDDDPPPKRLRSNSSKDKNVIDSPVAAAPSTGLYKSLYGGGGGRVVLTTSRRRRTTWENARGRRA